jgi:hypothetical protein
MTLYKVTGPTAYQGHQPGEEFEADLTADEERRAKERGAIRVVKRTTTNSEEEKADA